MSDVDKDLLFTKEEQKHSLLTLFFRDMFEGRVVPVWLAVAYILFMVLLYNVYVSWAP